MTPVLRDYQLEAVGAVLDGWEATADPGALLLATGLGKTVIFSELARISHALNHRTLILVHRDELVRQTVDKLYQANPAMRIGIVQGQSMGVFADAVVASVQTLARRLDKIRPDQFDRIVIDECHHAAAKSYMAILYRFGAYDGGVTRTVGVTATLARGDRQGLGAQFPAGVWYERGIAWGVEHGYLVPAEVRTVALAGLDTDTIRKGADGDLAAGQLGKAMSTADAGRHIAAAYARYAQDPYGRFRRAISFAPTIEIAEAWAGSYEAVGARVAVITGSTPPAERQRAYADVRDGRKDVLSSVMVLTEGFDLPAVEVAIVGRPTKSMPLLTQMVGRVLRPSPATGKTSALLLDVVGALGHGLARSHDLSIPGPDKPEAPEQDADELPRPPRDRIVLAPPEEVTFTVRDLLTGEVLKTRARRKGMLEPEWLRTKGGVPFLPATPDFPWRIFCWARDDSPSPWWRLERLEGCAPEALQLADGADIRDLHPGMPGTWAVEPATRPQADLCAKLALGSPATKLEASTLIETYFAGRVLDRLCRPKMVVQRPPGVN
jgi:superfamily II DNA or RNA helicase